MDFFNLVLNSHNFWDFVDLINKNFLFFDLLNFYGDNSFDWDLNNSLNWVFKDFLDDNFLLDDLINWLLNMDVIRDINVDMMGDWLLDYNVNEFLNDSFVDDWDLSRSPYILINVLVNDIDISSDAGATGNDSGVDYSVFNNGLRNDSGWSSSDFVGLESITWSFGIKEIFGSADFSGFNKMVCTLSLDTDVNKSVLSIFDMLSNVNFSSSRDSLFTVRR
jgi:hypothetical protein